MNNCYSSSEEEEEKEKANKATKIQSRKRKIENLYEVPVEVENELKKVKKQS